ncbi:DUF4190 domain-containing protein [Salinibacterium sp. M195]|uniref:DUF4190 domain-containing protein n=1 Tax=Salinibacterium sp. M195 TaxID=2583374 RepID=UPI001C62FF00|nr:DUF4190 domain-containing protein [Salinibacterium sp. M195]
MNPKWNFCINCGEPLSADVVRPAPPVAARTSPLAILALVLAAIGGAPALLFGHLAIRQIKETGERGLVMARVATVLGYVWLVVWGVVLYSLLTNDQ